MCLGCNVGTNTWVRYRSNARRSIAPSRVQGAWTPCKVSAALNVVCLPRRGTDSVARWSCPAVQGRQGGLGPTCVQESAECGAMVARYRARAASSRSLARTGFCMHPAQPPHRRFPHWVPTDLCPPRAVFHHGRIRDRLHPGEESRFLRSSNATRQPRNGAQRNRTRVVLLPDEALDGFHTHGKSACGCCYRHVVLDSTVRLGILMRNPTDFADAPGLKAAEIHPLSETQARQMLQVVAGDHYEAVYVLALATGMRLGELLGLRWSDMDWDRHLISVRTTLHRVEHK